MNVARLQPHKGHPQPLAEATLRAGLCRQPQAFRQVRSYRLPGAVHQVHLDYVADEKACTCRVGQRLAPAASRLRSLMTGPGLRLVDVQLTNSAETDFNGDLKFRDRGCEKGIVHKRERARAARPFTADSAPGCRRSAARDVRPWPAA